MTRRSLFQAGLLLPARVPAKSDTVESYYIFHKRSWAQFQVQSSPTFSVSLIAMRI